METCLLKKRFLHFFHNKFQVSENTHLDALYGLSFFRASLPALSGEEGCIPA